MPLPFSPHPRRAWETPDLAKPMAVAAGAAAAVFLRRRRDAELSGGAGSQVGPNEGAPGETVPDPTEASPRAAAPPQATPEGPAGGDAVTEAPNEGATAHEPSP